MDSGRLHESVSSSPPLDTGSDSLIDSNTRFSYSSAEAAVSPSQNGVCLKKVLDGESKSLGPHPSMGVSEACRVFDENFADFSKQHSPNQESGVAVVVSTNLDGWQHFDSKENEGNGVFGCDRAIDEKSLQKRELWEQLLEEGSEDSETHFRMSTSQVEAETGIESDLYGGNQFWLASPGNPFIEGLDRLSNFSAADHCMANEFKAKSQLLDSFETDMGLPFKEGPFYTDHNSENFLQDKLVEGTQSNGLYDHESSRHPNPRFPSFSDIRRSSSKSRDPSFASFMEQGPAFHAGNYVHGIENGGEKWEANFDLMVPATQEGPRCLSLPREAGDTPGQRQKQTFSLFSREAPVTSQLKPSGFSSPKLSPIVKKVVNKVWTKPEVVANAVRHVKTSKTMDKEPKKCVWRCCICCSHAN